VIVCSAGAFFPSRKIGTSANTSPLADRPVDFNGRSRMEAELAFAVQATRVPVLVAGMITAVSRCSHTATTSRSKRYRPGLRHPGPSAGATLAVSRRQPAAGRLPLAPTCGHRRGVGGRASRSAWSLLRRRPPPDARVLDTETTSEVSDTVCVLISRLCRFGHPAPGSEVEHPWSHASDQPRARNSTGPGRAHCSGRHAVSSAWPPPAQTGVTG